jgi:hypothetical protein
MSTVHNHSNSPQPTQSLFDAASKGLKNYANSSLSKLKTSINSIYNSIQGNKIQSKDSPQYSTISQKIGKNNNEMAYAMPNTKELAKKVKAELISQINSDSAKIRKFNSLKGELKDQPLAQLEKYRDDINKFIEDREKILDKEYDSKRNKKSKQIEPLEENLRSAQATLDFLEVVIKNKENQDFNSFDFTDNPVNKKFLDNFKTLDSQIDMNKSHFKSLENSSNEEYQKCGKELTNLNNELREKFNTISNMLSESNLKGAENTIASFYDTLDQISKIREEIAPQKTKELL